jgi:hypothetical protein
MNPREPRDLYLHGPLAFLEIFLFCGNSRTIRATVITFRIFRKIRTTVINFTMETYQTESTESVHMTTSSSVAFFNAGVMWCKETVKQCLVVIYRSRSVLTGSNVTENLVVMMDSVEFQPSVFPYPRVFLRVVRCYT